MFEPKIPCSRETVNAATATTITMTIGTHTRLTSLINAPLPCIALPAWRFDVRPSQRVHLGTTTPTDLWASAAVCFAAFTPAEWPPDPARCFSSRPEIVASGRVKGRHPIRVIRKSSSARGFRRARSARPRGSSTRVGHRARGHESSQSSRNPPGRLHGRAKSARPVFTRFFTRFV